MAPRCRAADRALLKQLMPSVELPGAAVVVPPLLKMVTVVGHRRLKEMRER